jgi:hypothetical protein
MHHPEQHKQLDLLVLQLCAAGKLLTKEIHWESVIHGHDTPGVLQRAVMQGSLIISLS